MSTALVTITVLAGVGTVVGLVRTTVAYRRYRGAWIVECPETEASAEITLDTAHAALTSAAGAPQLQVRHCSRWPGRHDCDQSCLS
jgi:hypothetical protein